MATCEHAGKVQDGERAVDIGKCESIGKGRKEPSLSEHNRENFFARRTKENKIERGEKRN